MKKMTGIYSSQIGGSHCPTPVLLDATVDPELLFLFKFIQWKLYEFPAMPVGTIHLTVWEKLFGDSTNLSYATNSSPVRIFATIRINKSDSLFGESKEKAILWFWLSKSCCKKFTRDNSFVPIITGFFTSTLLLHMYEMQSYQKNQPTHLANNKTLIVSAASSPLRNMVTPFSRPVNALLGADRYRCDESPEMEHNPQECRCSPWGRDKDDSMYLWSYPITKKAIGHEGFKTGVSNDIVSFSAHIDFLDAYISHVPNWDLKFGAGHFYRRPITRAFLGISTASVKCPGFRLRKLAARIILLSSFSLTQQVVSLYEWRIGVAKALKTKMWLGNPPPMTGIEAEACLPADFSRREVVTSQWDLMMGLVYTTRDKARLMRVMRDDPQLEENVNYRFSTNSVLQSYNLIGVELSGVADGALSNVGSSAMSRLDFNIFANGGALEPMSHFPIVIEMQKKISVGRFAREDASVHYSEVKKSASLMANQTPCYLKARTPKEEMDVGIKDFGHTWALVVFFFFWRSGRGLASLVLAPRKVPRRASFSLELPAKDLEIWLSLGASIPAWIGRYWSNPSGPGFLGGIFVISSTPPHDILPQTLRDCHNYHIVMPSRDSVSNLYG
ncbi:uncharacterized protein BDR25DRAFT_353150 [Lindgomyces ingoldianus]|uniref:Uncharacterized protein n=1 Tax=Lindgomyces ingoldianus TaxID=673940 RepID=A0ACB6R1Y6_9PLEO|nr:uncharacterized protein BDR25DRAFT_353150 [Lindgomyces ingoldianus]KAF2472838.1 hypothetical protein BDR25DRAFT_353150 [Lindgomyces ingoldianus]